MREIQASQITAQLKALILQASYNIGSDVEAAVAAYKEKEPSPSGRAVLEQLLQNYAIAREEQVAICQDTGMCVIFLDVGQEVHIAGGSLQDALAEGVRQAYGEGYLRKSVVRDPQRPDQYPGQHAAGGAYPHRARGQDRYAGHPQGVRLGKHVPH